MCTMRWVREPAQRWKRGFSVSRQLSEEVCSEGETADEATERGNRGLGVRGGRGF